LINIKYLKSENMQEIIISEDEKEITLTDVSGNDIHWLAVGQENLEFEIKKGYSNVYNIFNELYENLLNYIMKQGPYVEKPYEDGKIKWYSDDVCMLAENIGYDGGDRSEVFDSVEIIKEENAIKLKFALAKIKLEYNDIDHMSCVRFRRSGSLYNDYFQVYFNKHFYQLCELILKNNQSKVEEKPGKTKKL